LAKGLATSRLSRWQVLKAVGAVSSLSLFGTLSPLRTPSAVAAPCPPATFYCEADPNPLNNRCESCAQLLTYMGTTGVIDGGGQPQPTYAGWTTPEWDVSVDSYSIRRGPYEKEKGQWCYEVRCTYSAKVKSALRTLRWVPTPPPPASCADKCTDAISRWCAAVDEHEQHHVQENRNIVSEAKAGAKFADFRPTFEVCASTTRFCNAACAQARALAKVHGAFLRERARIYSGTLFTQLEDEADRRADAFHRSPGDKHPPRRVVAVNRQSAARE